MGLSTRWNRGLYEQGGVQIGNKIMYIQMLPISVIQPRTIQDNFCLFKTSVSRELVITFKAGSGRATLLFNKMAI